MTTSSQHETPAVDELLRVSRRAKSRVVKHGLAVYPLETYGVLLGRRSPPVVLAALPVGKTVRWFDRTARFDGLPGAFTEAARVAGKFGLDVVGAYHTWSGGHPDFPGSEASPVEDAPASLRAGLLLVTPTEGRETIFASTIYASSPARGWLARPFRVVAPASLDLLVNARRVHSEWVRARGPIDLSNDHETELERLFGRERLGGE